jgi:hypothetical protein
LISSANPKIYTSISVSFLFIPSGFKNDMQTFYPPSILRLIYSNFPPNELEDIISSARVWVIGLMARQEINVLLFSFGGGVSSAKKLAMCLTSCLFDLSGGEKRRRSF